MLRHVGYIPREACAGIGQELNFEYLQRPYVPISAPEPAPEAMQRSYTDELQHQHPRANRPLGTLPIIEASTSLGVNETYKTLHLRREQGLTEKKVFRAWRKATRENQRSPGPVTDVQQSRIDTAFHLAFQDLRRHNTTKFDISKPMKVEVHSVCTEEELQEIFEELGIINYTLKKAKHSLLAIFNEIVQRLDADALHRPMNPFFEARINGLYAYDNYHPKDRPLLAIVKLLIDFICQIDRVRTALAFIGNEIVKPGRFDSEMRGFAGRFRIVIEDSWFRKQCKEIVDAYQLWMVERVGNPCFDWTKGAFYTELFESPINRTMCTFEWKKVLVLVDIAERTQRTAEMLADKQR